MLIINTITSQLQTHPLQLISIPTELQDWYFVTKSISDMVREHAYTRTSNGNFVNLYSGYGRHWYVQKKERIYGITWKHTFNNCVYF